MSDINLKMPLTRQEMKNKSMEKFKVFCAYFIHPIFSEKKESTITPYSKIPFKQLISYFEDKNFADLSNSKIALLCAEVNNRVCRKLSCYASKIVCEQGEKNESFMIYYPEDNSINMYADFIKSFLSDRSDEIGLEFLFSILHETYHACQTENVKNFMQNKPCNMDMLNSYVQNTINLTDQFFMENIDKIFTVKIDNNKYSPSFYELYFTRGQMDYVSDFQEFEANYFALKMLKNFEEKGYLKNSKLLNSVCFNAINEMSNWLYIFNKQEKHFNKTKNELLYIADKIPEDEIRMYSSTKPKIVGLLKNFDTEKIFADRKSKLRELIGMGIVSEQQNLSNNYEK